MVQIHLITVSQSASLSVCPSLPLLLSLCVCNVAQIHLTVLSLFLPPFLYRLFFPPLGEGRVSVVTHTLLNDLELWIPLLPHGFQDYECAHPTRLCVVEDLSRGFLCDYPAPSGASHIPSPVSLFLSWNHTEITLWLELGMLPLSLPRAGSAGSHHWALPALALSSLHFRGLKT